MFIVENGTLPAAMGILALVLLPMVMACVVFALGKNGWNRQSAAAVIAAVVAEFVLMLCLLPAMGCGVRLDTVAGLGMGFRLDSLGAMYAVLASFLWLMTSLFAREYMKKVHNKTRYYTFLLLTEGAILGVFLSADLYTTLICFEVMSVTSWTLVAHEETAGARRAADSYLAFAVIGGLATLMGLFLLYHLLGTLEIDKLRQAAAACPNRAMLYTAGGFTLVGFAAKAGMWPLHTWLPAAHPVAPAPASALLSGIITKAGVFGILVLGGEVFFHDAQWGMVMLCFGLVTMFTGALIGVFSTNLKHTLACSSMSQIGFILVGVGMAGLLGHENGMAVWGLLLHCCNHAIFKLCLFLCAGVVVMNLHALELNDIRGFGRGKPLFMAAFAMATLGIMGIPGWSGYVSKTLLHESIVEYVHLLTSQGADAGFFRFAEWVFLISGGMTVTYMTKLFVCIFVEKNTDPARQAAFDSKNGCYASPLSCGVLAVAASLPLILGLTAHSTMEAVAAAAGGFFETEGPEHTVHYFAFANLKGGLISVAIGVVLYLAVVRGLVCAGGKYRDLWPRWLNVENLLYRPLLLKVLPFIGALAARFAASVPEWLRMAGEKLLWLHDRDGYVYPETDDHFTIYEQQPKGVRGFIATLSFSMMLFGFGLVAVLLYLLTR